MNDRKKITIGVLLWCAAVTVLHLLMNVNWAVMLNDRLPLDKRKLNVAYIPVT